MHNFVQAKQEINAIFGHLTKYLEACDEFLADYKIAFEDERDIDKFSREVSDFLVQVSSISEIISRDQMKVAFFGRTSNGKSTTVNAMLQDKILPTGMGHTTNCFLSVHGSDLPDPYILLPGSDDKKNVKSLGQLAHALCKEKLDPSSLVQVFWPKSRCKMLSEDVVLVDSPGIDVSHDLNQWIEKHCLDADVFVLVANAESTLTVAECITKSAIQTKFESHAVSGLKIANTLKVLMEQRVDSASQQRSKLEEIKKKQENRLEYVKEQLGIYTSDTERQIKEITSKVQSQVTEAMTEEIGRLDELVNEFDHPFHPHPKFLETYKKELYNHIKSGLGRNMVACCSTFQTQVICEAQKEMADRLRSLFPETPEVSLEPSTPALDFQANFELDVPRLCTDFREDIEFRNEASRLESELSQFITEFGLEKSKM